LSDVKVGKVIYMSNDKVHISKPHTDDNALLWSMGFSGVDM